MKRRVKNKTRKRVIKGGNRQLNYLLNSHFYLQNRNNQINRRQLFSNGPPRNPENNFYWGGYKRKNVRKHTRKRKRSRKYY